MTHRHRSSSANRPGITYRLGTQLPPHHGSPNRLFTFYLAFHCSPVTRGCVFRGIFKAQSKRKINRFEGHAFWVPSLALRVFSLRLWKAGTRAVKPGATLAPSYSFSCSPRMFELLLPVGLGMWFDQTPVWESCYGLTPRAPP